MPHIWDLPVIIFSILMVIMFFVHRSNMIKLEDAYEKKLLERVNKQKEDTKDENKTTQK